MKKYCEPAIHELLKPLASGAVYALRAPDNAKGPFIIFQQIDSERWRDINGPAGQKQVYMQIDCYDISQYGAKDLGGEVETILDGFAGTVYYGTDSPQKFVKIGGITCQGDDDLIDQTAKPLLHRNSAVYLITHEQ